MKCFIAAPVGIDLGCLPSVLSDKAISWEWATETTAVGPLDAIRRCDFVIGILNGSKSDQQALFELGVAAGLGKRIFLITNGRRVGFETFGIPAIKLSLKDSVALAFRLELFLASPYREYPSAPPPLSSPISLPKEQFGNVKHGGVTQLERRAYDIIGIAGGRAILEPEGAISESKRYRPDLLAWLGHLDAELLDPTVIEVKTRVDEKDAFRLEERLLSFMQSSGVRTAFILTAVEPPVARRHLSAYIYWLTIDAFEELARTAKLGHFVRAERNRAMHGRS